MGAAMAVQRYKRSDYVKMTGTGELRTSIITNMTTMFQLQLLDKKISIMNHADQRKQSQLNKDLIIDKLISTAEV